MPVPPREAGSPRSTALNRAVNVVLQQSGDKICRLLSSRPLNACVVREFPRRLPQDIVEIITAQFIFDLVTLKACSLTCRSWYIAAAPHLHYALVLGLSISGHFHKDFKPLSKLHKLGLTPLVKELRVRQWRWRNRWFVPSSFGQSNLCCFSTLTNVQTLKIHNLELGLFSPGLERYFGHFTPTLRSITLYHPESTDKQLRKFFSLFLHLEEIEAWWNLSYPPYRPIATLPHLELCPPPALKLRGRLIPHGSHGVGSLADPTVPESTPRFCHLDTYKVATHASALLEGSGETLETLRVYAVRDSIGISLSQFKTLRALHVGALVTDTRSEGTTVGTTCNSTVVDAFSTITSPVFSELVIVLRRNDIAMLHWDTTLFQTLSTMNMIRPFELVFLLEVMDLPGEERRMLEDTLKSVAAKGLLHFLKSLPIIRVELIPPEKWEPCR